MDEKRTKLSSGTYLLLFIVITLGVSAGTLLAHAIELKIAEMALSEALQEFSATHERHTKDAEAELAAKEHQARQERTQSRIGRELHRICQEWRASHSTNNTYTTKTEMDKSCGVYERYIATGAMPPDGR